MGTYGKSPEIVREIIEDRWEQVTAVVDVDVRDSSSEIAASPIYNQLSEILHKLGGALAGEVAPFGMRDVTDGLMETIGERLCAWAIAYTLGERTGDAAPDKAGQAA